MASFFRDDDDDSVMADINVTPLVDVMLVLLIIFMIATPMLHQGIEVNLPRVDAQTIPLRENDPMVVTVQQNDVVFLKDQPIHITKLVESLRPEMERRIDQTVYLKGDRSVAYGAVLRVIGILNEAGITRVALVTEPPPRRQSGDSGP